MRAKERQRVILAAGIGLLIVTIGPVIATKDETVDGLRGQRPGVRVEPTRWKLPMTRAFGLGVANLGLWVQRTDSVVI